MVLPAAWCCQETLQQSEVFDYGAGAGPICWTRNPKFQSSQTVLTQWINWDWIPEMTALEFWICFPGICIVPNLSKSLLQFTFYDILYLLFTSHFFVRFFPALGSGNTRSHGIVLPKALQRKNMGRCPRCPRCPVSSETWPGCMAV